MTRDLVGGGSPGLLTPHPRREGERWTRSSRRSRRRSRRGSARYRREHRLPGIVAGIATRDGLPWWHATGFADIETSRRRGTERTLHRVASITKTITATAVMQLRDEGHFRLDDPVVRFLPELERIANPHGSHRGPDDPAAADAHVRAPGRGPVAGPGPVLAVPARGARRDPGTRGGAHGAGDRPQVQQLRLRAARAARRAGRGRRLLTRTSANGSWTRSA